MNGYRKFADTGSHPATLATPATPVIDGNDDYQHNQMVTDNTPPVKPGDPPLLLSATPATQPPREGAKVARVAPSSNALAAETIPDNSCQTLGFAAPAAQHAAQSSGSSKSSRGIGGNGDFSFLDDPGPWRFWSEVLQAEFWGCTTPQQAEALTQAGCVAYLPDEVRLLRQLKEAAPESFDDTVRTLHQLKAVLGCHIDTAGKETTHA